MEPICRKSGVAAVVAVGLFALGVAMSCARARIEARWLREIVSFAGVLCVVGCVMAITVLCEKPKPGVKRMRRVWLFLLLTLFLWSLELFVRFVFVPFWK
jgi:hypothetical protein